MDEKKQDVIDKRLTQDFRELAKTFEIPEDEDILSVLDNGVKRNIWIKVVVRDAYEAGLIDKTLRDMVITDCERLDDRFKFVKTNLRHFREMPKIKDGLASHFAELAKILFQREGLAWIQLQGACVLYMLLSLIKEAAAREEIKKQGILLKKKLEEEQAKREKFMEKYVA